MAFSGPAELKNQFFASVYPDKAQEAQQAAEAEANKPIKTSAGDIVFQRGRVIAQNTNPTSADVRMAGIGGVGGTGSRSGAGGKAEAPPASAVDQSLEIVRSVTKNAPEGSRYTPDMGAKAESLVRAIHENNRDEMGRYTLFPEAAAEAATAVAIDPKAAQPEFNPETWTVDNTYHSQSTRKAVPINRDLPFSTLSKEQQTPEAMQAALKKGLGSMEQKYPGISERMLRAAGGDKKAGVEVWIAYRDARLKEALASEPKATPEEKQQILLTANKLADMKIADFTRRIGLLHEFKMTSVDAVNPKTPPTPAVRRTPPPPPATVKVYGADKPNPERAAWDKRYSAEWAAQQQAEQAAREAENARQFNTVAPRMRL
jgi:hypothetical protein